MSKTSSTRGLEWAAGLFEGEGTILIRKRPEDQIAVSLTSTDEDVVVEFCKVVGQGKVYGPYSYDTVRKPFWKWNADGEKAAFVLRSICPYLLSRRMSRATEALGRWTGRQARPYYTVSRKGMGGKPTHKKEKL